MTGLLGAACRSRWVGVYRARVWWPVWVGRGARAWQGAVVAVVWPIALWTLGTVLFWAAGHTLRLLLIATAFGWLGMACCAAAAVLPFAGGVMLLAALFRAAPASGDRDRALRHADVGAGV